MGVTTNAYLYIGVTLDRICSIEEDVQTYDKHDEKTGQKTGEKIVEKNFYLHILGRDKELLRVNDQGHPVIHSDEFDVGEFGNIHQVHQFREGDLSNHFIGLHIGEAGEGPGIFKTHVDLLMEKQAEVTDLLHKYFGYKGGVEVILQHYISC